MLFATLCWFDVLHRGVYIHNIEYKSVVWPFELELDHMPMKLLPETI